MEEIANKVYIEASYPGVILGAIAFSHGLIMIDAPPRPEDGRLWRATLHSMEGGIDRLLINLDSHFDRTLGVRNMECSVVAHDKTAQVFRTRPTAVKSQVMVTGAEWERMGPLGTIRWAPPEITLSQTLNIYWDDHPLLIEHHPGPNPGAVWVVLPVEKVLFLGDAVIPNQPPYLANADLPVWIDQLESLVAGKYHTFHLVSSRCGIVRLEQVVQQIQLLKRIHEQLEDLVKLKANAETTEKLVGEIMEAITFPEERRDQYVQRLRWGLYHYYSRHYRAAAIEGEE